MHDVDAFEDTVSAYPAITVLRNGLQGRAHVVEAMDGFGAADGRTVAQWLVDGRDVVPDEGCFNAARLDRWFGGSGLWPSGSPLRLELLSHHNLYCVVSDKWDLNAPGCCGYARPDQSMSWLVVMN